jgi:hypothetical protein
MGTGGPFHGAKARPGRDADHSPPSSAEVDNEYELYLLSPKRLRGVWWDRFLVIIVLSESDFLLRQSIIGSQGHGVIQSNPDLQVEIDSCWQ